MFQRRGLGKKQKRKKEHSQQLTADDARKRTRPGAEEEEEHSRKLAADALRKRTRQEAEEEGVNSQKLAVR